MKLNNKSMLLVIACIAQLVAPHVVTASPFSAALFMVRQSVGGSPMLTVKTNIGMGIVQLVKSIPVCYPTAYFAGKWTAEAVAFKTAHKALDSVMSKAEQKIVQEKLDNNPQDLTADEKIKIRRVLEAIKNEK